MVEWESLHELDAIRYLEYSPLVVAYEAQPSVETYYKQGVPHKYYPDLRARLIDDSIIDIEVKPKAKLARSKAKDKYGRIASMYSKQGRRFRILTEDDYRCEPLHANLVRLHRASKLCSRIDDSSRLLATLGGRDCWKLSDAASILGSADSVLALVSVELLRIDLRKPICGDSLVWLPTPATMEGWRDDSLFV
jgi:hypothetical protein